MASSQSTISSHTGLEIVQYERGGDEDDRGVYCPDCGSVVSASKGAHEAPDSCDADRIWGWFCRHCQNVLPSNAHGPEASGFNNRIVAIETTPRGGEQRWIPVPASAVDGDSDV